MFHCDFRRRRRMSCKSLPKLNRPQKLGRGKSDQWWWLDRRSKWNRWGYEMAFSTKRCPRQNGILINSKNYLRHEFESVSALSQTVCPITCWTLPWISVGFKSVGSAGHHFYALWPQKITSSKMRTYQNLIDAHRDTDGAENGLSVYWMTYRITGQTMNEIEMTTEVASRLWEAVSGMWRSGLAHHDLVPRNVMYGTIKQDRQKRIFILDNGGVQKTGIGAERQPPPLTNDLASWPKWLRRTSHPDETYFMMEQGLFFMLVEALEKRSKTALINDNADEEKKRTKL